MTTHNLKTKKEYFEQNLFGRKPCTIRKNDRDFKIGDIVIKEEIDDAGEKTGRTSKHEIINIIDFPDGLKDGYVLLILKKIECITREEKYKNFIHKSIENTKKNGSKKEKEAHIIISTLEGKAIAETMGGIYYICEDSIDIKEAIKSGRYKIREFSTEYLEFNFKNRFVVKIMNWKRTKDFTPSRD